MADLIETQLASIDFGVQHKESVKSCESLKRKLDESGVILDDQEYLIHEMIGEFKNKIQLRGDQLTMLINQITNSLVVDLDKFKSRCVDNLSSLEFKLRLDEVREQKRSALEKYAEWLDELNKLKFDESKWKKIKLDSDSSLKEINKSIECFEKAIFLDELGSNKAKSDFFDYMDLFTIIKTSVSMLVYIFFFRFLK